MFDVCAWIMSMVQLVLIMLWLLSLSSIILVELFPFYLTWYWCFVRCGNEN